MALPAGEDVHYVIPVDPNSGVAAPRSGPAADAFAVTPSNSTNFTQGTAVGLYVGVTGDVVLVTPAGNAVTFKAAPVGFLPVACIRVNSTGTTATNIVGLL